MTMLAAILVCAAAFAQGQLVTWSSHVEKAEGDVYKVIFTGKVADGYHTYTLTDEFSATEVMDAAVAGGLALGSFVNVLARKALTIALFFIGASLSLNVLRQVGLKPIMLGVLLWILISVLSLIYIQWDEWFMLT